MPSTNPPALALPRLDRLDTDGQDGKPISARLHPPPPRHICSPRSQGPRRGQNVYEKSWPLPLLLHPTQPHQSAWELRGRNTTTMKSPNLRPLDLSPIPLRVSGASSFKHRSKTIGWGNFR